MKDRGPTLWNPAYEAMVRSKRRRRLLDPRQALFESSKSNAKSNGREHNLTINDIVIPDTCPILGVRLLKDGRHDNSPSVDRVDTSKGYIRGNVRVISWRANRLKSNMTLAEAEAICQYMKQNVS